MPLPTAPETGTECLRHFGQYYLTLVMTNAVVVLL
jgi:hypothetical protein